MAIKIEQYGPQRLSTQFTRTPLRERPRDADTSVARSITTAGNVLGQIADDISTTEAEETLVKFEREKNSLFHNPDGGYFKTQGKTAYDKAQDTRDALEKLREEYGSSLVGPARNKFDRVAEKHVTDGLEAIDRWAGKGFKAWEVATVKSSNENAIENVALNWDDPKTVALNLELGRAGVREAARLEGLDTPELIQERLENFDHAAAQGAIEAATASSAKDGRDALEKYGDMLEGSLKDKMKEKVEVKSRQEKERDDAIAAVAITNNMLNKHDTLDAIQTDIRETYKDDPELMDKILRESHTQFVQKRAAENDARAQNFEKIEQAMYKGATVEQVKAAFGPQFDDLTVKEKRLIEAGIPIVTNWDKYNKFMLMTPTDLAKVNPNDYVPYLAKDERNKFYSAFNAARKGDKSNDHQIGRSRVNQTTAAVEQIIGKKRKAWNIETMGKADRMYALIDNEARAREDELGRKLTSAEYTDVVNSMTRTVVQDRLFGLYEQEVGLSTEILDLSQVKTDTLTRMLRNKGLPVTSDNLINLYEQLKGSDLSEWEQMGRENNAQ